jgi:hypothetical protein
MTNYKHLFAEMTELREIVPFRDTFKVKVKGKNMKFLQKNGKFRMIEDIYYNSDLNNNIMS